MRWKTRFKTNSIFLWIESYKLEGVVVSSTSEATEMLLRVDSIIRAKPKAAGPITSHFILLLYSYILIPVLTARPIVVGGIENGPV
ncbi:hypothetical protein HOY82DRAFT_483688 [Tuber indicum]|nr:hypothetical protein HOY82DRAFT_483688 [Tuber indicum]